MRANILRMTLVLTLHCREWMQRQPSMCSNVDALRWPSSLPPLAHREESIRAEEVRTVHLPLHSQAYPNSGFQEQIKRYEAMCRGGGASGAPGPPMPASMGPVRMYIFTVSSTDSFACCAGDLRLFWCFFFGTEYLFVYLSLELSACLFIWAWYADGIRRPGDDEPTTPGDDESAKTSDGG